MGCVETIAPIILEMSEDEVKDELIELLSLESDEEKLRRINTLIKRIGNKIVAKNSNING